MKIASELSGSLAASATQSARQPASENFADTFKKVLSSTGKAKAEEAEKSASQTRLAREEAIRSAYKAVVAELNDYMKKSPAEHMRDAVLKELGLTEEDLAAMPPEKRMAMEATINERIREKLLGRKAAPEEDEASSARRLEPATAKIGSELTNGMWSSLAASSLTAGLAKAA